MARIVTVLFSVALLAGTGAGPPAGTVKELPEAVKGNKNTLVKAYRGKLKVTASTFWPGWEPGKVIDENLETSWFTQRGDAAAKGTKPWVRVTFPEGVTVKRVTVVGNREPAWYDGYTIVSGLIELHDADGKLLWADENKGVGNRRDFAFVPKKPLAKVRSITFTSLKDQGDKNPYDDIAIAEILIE
jgi:hypothetical protein